MALYNRTIRLITFIMTWFVALTAAAVTVDEIQNVHIENRHRFVTDGAGVLSPATVSRLDTAIDSVWQSTSAEMVVVTVDEVDPSMTPDEFATALFEKWGIGKGDKDNGLLMLISTGDRRAVIRTGYGVEGVIPDIIAGRIIRNDMAPYFSTGDYESGITAGTAALIEKLTDPTVAAELRSSLPNDRISSAQAESMSGDEFFMLYLNFSLWVGLACLVWVIFTIATTRKLDEVLRYRRIDSIRPVLMFISFLSLGMALPAFLLAVWKARRIRRHPHDCPNCGTRMNLVDEENDNSYLTAAQDAEEKIDSVDYDVWLCPQCNTTEILPYVNLRNNYSVCPRCHARAMTLVDSQVTVPPTTRQEGVRTDTYVCKACGNRTNHTRKIPRHPDNSDAALAAGAILGSLSGRGGGGLGGFGGGSFGGGSTGGGGASGGW